MSHVLLINPPYGDMQKSAEAIVPPLGIAYIASYLREHDIDIDIVDCTPENIDQNNIGDIISKKNPSIIGLTATTPMINRSIKFADLIKIINPEVKIMIGGPHVTAMAEDTLAHANSIDLAIRGEGELTMLEVVKEFDNTNPDLSKILGITYRSSQGIRSNNPRPLIENLDILPFPARDLLPIKKYRPSIKWYNRMPFTTMFTSRGCPFNCIFCDSHLTFGHITRYRSAQNVLDEIQELIEKYKIKDLIFYDDTFTLNKKRTIEICDGIVERGLNITWGCLSRVNTANEEMLLKMKKAGCHMISFGVESGSERMLRIIRKGITLQQSESALRNTRQVGIDSTATFVIGIPGETRESICETIDFAKKINPTYAQFFRAVPYPGTELSTMLSREGKVLNNSWEQYMETSNVPMIEIDGINSHELEQMSKDAYKKFYYRPSKIFEYMLKASSPHKLLGYYRALTTFRKLS